MALSVTNLASSLSSLSFSSQVSHGPNTLSFPRSNYLFSLPAKSARRASLSITATVAAPAEVSEDDTMELKKYVKSRLPGGFAAQKIIGTGRRKCAIARVVLQEGTGKVIINYRDAKVSNIECVFLLRDLLVFGGSWIEKKKKKGYLLLFCESWNVFESIFFCRSTFRGTRCGFSTLKCR